jgi:hypothetical protein
MLTTRTIMAMYNKGHIDEAYKEVRRCGKITKDKAWDTDSGYYAGSSRALTIDYLGVTYNIQMLNGEVISFGHNYVKGG